MAKLSDLTTVKFAVVTYYKNRFAVEAELPGGNVVLHERRFKTADPAKRLADRVRAKGMIDIVHWFHYRVIPGSDAAKRLSMGIPL